MFIGGGSGGEGGEGRVDNLEQANQELQRLRTHAGSLQAELLDAQSEAEVRIEATCAARYDVERKKKKLNCKIFTIKSLKNF